MLTKKNQRYTHINAIQIQWEKEMFRKKGKSLRSKTSAEVFSWNILFWWKENSCRCVCLSPRIHTLSRAYVGNLFSTLKVLLCISIPSSVCCIKLCKIIQSDLENYAGKLCWTENFWMWLTIKLCFQLKIIKVSKTVLVWCCNQYRSWKSLPM